MTRPVSETFTTIKLKQLREAKWNPRKTFEKKALEELTASVKSKGVLVPLLVRPFPDGPGSSSRTAGLFEIVAGARRFRAAKEAGLDEVPVIVRVLSDAEALETAVVENAMRADVHPLEESEGYAELLKIEGYDVQKIAAKTGHSLSHIYQRLQLAKLIGPAKKAFLEEQITAGHAVELARLMEKDQEDALEQCFDKWDPMTIRDLRDWIEREIHLDLAAAPWKKDDAGLLPAAGSCLTCTKRTGTTPGLWPDVKKKDTCTDRECFGAKRAAWVERRVEESQMKLGVAVLRLSTDHHLPSRPRGEKLKKDDPPPPIPASRWTSVPAKKRTCDSMRWGVVVDGHGGTIGEQKAVCTDPKCKVHRTATAAPASGGNESWRKRQFAQEKKAKRERLERRAILEAVLAKTDHLDDDDLLTVAAGLLHEMQHEPTKEIVKRHGWPVKEQKYSTDYRGAALKAIEGMGYGPQVYRILLELALSHALHVSANWSGDPKLLLATAKRKGVDVAKVRKAAGEEEKPKRSRGAQK